MMWRPTTTKAAWQQLHRHPLKICRLQDILVEKPRWPPETSSGRQGEVSYLQTCLGLSCHLKQVGQFAEQFSGYGQQDSKNSLQVTGNSQKVPRPWPFDRGMMEYLCHLWTFPQWILGLQDSMELIEYVLDGLKEEHSLWRFLWNSRRCLLEPVLEPYTCCRNLWTWEDQDHIFQTWGCLSFGHSK